MVAVIEFLSSLSIWHWWILAAVLLILELATGTTYLLWPAAAAAAVGLLVGLPIPFGWELQLLSFAVLTTALTMSCGRFVRERWMRSDKPTLNQRGDQLIGQRVVVASDFAAGVGRVRVGDSIWRARLDDGDSASEGDVVEITGLDGVTLSVRALPAAASAPVEPAAR